MNGPYDHRGPYTPTESLRAALTKRLQSLPVLMHDNQYPVEALPKSELLDLLTLHRDDARPENEVKAEALREAAAWIKSDPGRTSGEGIAEWLNTRAGRIAGGAS